MDYAGQNRDSLYSPAESVSDSESADSVEATYDKHPLFYRLE